jgi:SAM-dependent methyltransferase
VLCVDGKSQIQALDRSAPVLPLLPGVPGRHTHDYVRNGTTNLYAAQAWQMTGVEPSAEACAAARARGIDVRQGTLADAPLDQAAYDVAVLQHSLEHMTDPVADLQRVRAALWPDGVVLVTVPNFSS